MKTSLIKALALSLHAAAIQADELYNQARNEEVGEVVGGLAEVLSQVFSGKRDNAEQAPDVQPAAPEAPVDVTSTSKSSDAAQAPVIKAPIEIINDMLNDERFKLRSFTSIKEKTGLDKDAVIDLLDDNDVDYTVLTKRHSDEQVVGLTSRN